MLKFKVVRFRNLLSTGNQFTEISLDSHKTTLIIGENGAGKTTVIDAIFYSLYGKPLRLINKPQLVNTITGRDLLVEIEFDIGSNEYLIRRGMKPNVFEIYLNGSLLDQDAASKDQQEYLETQILKMNFKSFSQIVVLSMANYTPFMKLPAQGKREVIEDLLDIQIFTVMNTLLKDEVASNRDHLVQIDNSINTVQKLIEVHKKHIAEMNQNNEDLIAAKRTTIAEHRAKIATYDEQAAMLSSAIENGGGDRRSEIKTLTASAKKTSDDIAKLKAHKTKVQKEIDFYAHSETCPTCLQNIDVSFRDEQIADKKAIISKVDDALPKLQKSLETTNEEAKTVAAIQIENDKLREKVSYMRNETNAYQRLIDALETEIKNLEERKISIKEDNGDYNKFVDQLTSHMKSKESAIVLREVYGMAATMLKDGGIKSQIIRQYIPIMNKLINTYLAKMDFFVDFHLDETFKETLKSRFRDEFSYESFSRGEQLRIDLALLFSWRAIAKMRNSTSTNLLFFDEILDSSLDIAGMDEFLDIVTNLTGDTNLFIISHKEHLVEKFERLLVVKKSNNFSRVYEQ